MILHGIIPLNNGGDLDQRSWTFCGHANFYLENWYSEHVLGLITGSYYFDRILGYYYHWLSSLLSGTYFWGYLSTFKTWGYLKFRGYLGTLLKPCFFSHFCINMVDFFIVNKFCFWKQFSIYYRWYRPSVWYGLGLYVTVWTDDACSSHDL